MSNLAYTRKRKGMHAEVELMAEVAGTKRLGSNHPDTRDAVTTLDAWGLGEEASPLYEDDGVNVEKEDAA